MLNALKGKLGFGKKEGEVIGSPIEGKAVAISEVSDPTFGQEILGKGMAVIPTVGKVVAPVDGRIEMIFDTKHAISMKTAGGAELLIHIGLDTVNLKGEPFTAHVSAGQEVKAGTPLIRFNRQKIKEAGYSDVTVCVITDGADAAMNRFNGHK